MKNDETPDFGKKWKRRGKRTQRRDFYGIVMVGLP
jgi:hypothetical protein